MPEKPKRRTPSQRGRAGRSVKSGPAESRLSVATTVAWTVSVTTVLLCNLASAAAHFIAGRQPQVAGMALLSQWLLLSGGLIGVASLVLLPIVYRVRRDPPPTPVVAFAVLAAIAPIVAIAMKIARQL